MKVIAIAAVALVMFMVGIFVGLADPVPSFTLSLDYQRDSALSAGSDFTSAAAPAPTTPAATTPPPAPTIEPTSEPADLIMVGSWQGTGIKTTEPFTITSSPWHIVWDNDPMMSGGDSLGILQVMVYDVSTPDFPITIAANSMKKTLDTSYVYQTGTFYLTINAANTEWDVSVFAGNN